jgi:hypothetical protein
VHIEAALEQPHCDPDTGAATLRPRLEEWASTHPRAQPHWPSLTLRGPVHQLDRLGRSWYSWLSTVELVPVTATILQPPTTGRRHHELAPGVPATPPATH